MMRYAILAGALAFTAAPAMAQHAGPGKAFAEEWQTIVASDALAAASHRHIAELAQKLLTDYEAKLDELKKTKDELDSDEARLATAMDWLKSAQAKTGQAAPVEVKP